MARMDSPAVTQAKGILRGEAIPPPDESLKLAKDLKQEKRFRLAWQILARARRNPGPNPKSSMLLQLAQQQALCTYKDTELPAEQRFDRALQILERDCDLANTTNQETLGLAGAVHKYRWQWDSHPGHLERSLYYYLRGYGAGNPANNDYDNGYTGINAAFVLDLLASLEKAETSTVSQESDVAAGRRAKAQEIRQELVELLPKRSEQEKHKWLATKWWFLVTIAEAFFGLGTYKQAIAWLKRADELPDVADWEKESTVRQLAALARIHETEGIAREPWEVLQSGLGLTELAARMVVVGKVGLALSGGGFRASLFHIGVLARLAELDVLRHVEVLSCVSGGSIIGAHYYLEVRKLLQRKPDREVTRNDYIDIVRRLADAFLEGVQQNLRTQVAAEFTTNIRMLLSPTYSHTERIGELYEKRLFARVGDQGKKFWLNELFIRPENERQGFQPKLHNWRRDAKAPVLILNAATLNTCHNWQFTASYMGESPILIDSEIDGNERLRRMYYDEAPDGYQRFRLGRAVAASSCVPGLFTPIALPDLYPDRTVRLVDGGVHDNQGAAGLLEQECSVLLVSDASGQTGAAADPSHSPLGVLWRADNVLQARLRQTQFADEEARRRSGLLRGLMVVHLKKDLDVDPVDWKDCPDPFKASEEARPVERRGPLTPYGIQKVIQGNLAALRTDLDSFSDLEAFALMTSGYLMTENEFPRGVPDFPISKAGSVPWRFLAALRDWMKRPVNSSDERLHMLDVGKHQVFKIWFLSRGLQVAGVAIGFFLLLLAIGALYLWWGQPLLTVGGAVVAALWAIAALALGTVVKFIRFRQTAMITLGVSLVGWAVARLHLWYFDRLFLKRGELPHLTHEQALEWIRQHKGLWHRVKKSKTIHARSIGPDEQDKEFHTAEGTTQRPQEGHWLCVGIIGEPWFQKNDKLESKYERAGVETKQFEFDDRPREYHIYKPKEDVRNWAIQVQDGEGMASFSFRPSYDPSQPLMAPAGAYVVTDDAPAAPEDPAGLKDIWLVQQAIFKNTYDPV
jgi:predicted acylesterase/phospholipase RssA